jgi:hypothetical protein
MVTKWKSVKTDEKKIDRWEKAAQLAYIDGRPSFNHWAITILDRAANREIKKNENSI